MGLPFLLFFPGYTLIAALFPNKDDLDDVERIALSFGLSIAVVPLIGLVLNYTPWGIRLYPILISLIVFIFVMATIALARQKFVVSTPEIHFGVPEQWKEQSTLDKVLTGILCVAIIGAIGTLIYVINSPKVGEQFTEFYIVNAITGMAEDYPQDVVQGEEIELKLGIANHERENVTYAMDVVISGQRLNVWLDGVEQERIITGVLAHDELWEESIVIIPEEASASTTLNSSVEAEEQDISVAASDNLDQGDYIQIGASGSATTEFAQIATIDDTEGIITLEEPLSYEHASSTIVTEKLKLEFVLFKRHEIETDDEIVAILDLSINDDDGDAFVRVINQEESQNIYRVSVGAEKSDVETTESASLDYLEDWEQQVNFSVPEDVSNRKVTFTLLKEDGTLLYEEDGVSYPGDLHLWIEVKENS